MIFGDISCIYHDRLMFENGSLSHAHSVGLGETFGVIWLFDWSRRLLSMQCASIACLVTFREYDICCTFRRTVSKMVLSELPKDRAILETPSIAYKATIEHHPWEHYLHWSQIIYYDAEINNPCR